MNRYQALLLDVAHLLVASGHDATHDVPCNVCQALDLIYKGLAERRWEYGDENDSSGPSGGDSGK